MVTFCLALRHCTDEERQKVAIAACYHDIGLWTARTMDYLPPSVPPAMECLKARGPPALGRGSQPADHRASQASPVYGYALPAR
jgi:hypothetical protein